MKSNNDQKCNLLFTLNMAKDIMSNQIIEMNKNYSFYKKICLKILFNFVIKNYVTPVACFI